MIVYDHYSFIILKLSHKKGMKSFSFIKASKPIE